MLRAWNKIARKAGNLLVVRIQNGPEHKRIRTYWKGGETHQQQHGGTLGGRMRSKGVWGTRGVNNLDTSSNIEGEETKTVNETVMEQKKIKKKRG